MLQSKISIGKATVHQTEACLMTPSPLPSGLHYISSLFHRYFTCPRPHQCNSYPSILSLSTRQVLLRSKSIDSIQLSRRLNLTSGPLSSDRQTHGVSPTPITAHILQSQDILCDPPPRISLYRHVCEFRCKSRLGLGVEIAHSCTRVNRKFGEDTAG